MIYQFSPLVVIETKDVNLLPKRLHQKRQTPRQRRKRQILVQGHGLWMKSPDSTLKRSVTERRNFKMMPRREIKISVKRRQPRRKSKNACALKPCTKKWMRSLTPLI
jgi:hypothetical protein